ncbi:MAG TPA: hypothetical protein VMW34_07975 [Anaerolineales bacterium]|nr:hypothetical protein [Anaerolineales bacterium]
MTALVELIPLRCIRCETPVPAEAGQVAWSCSQCHQGLLLDENIGLTELAIHYAGQISPTQTGRPFWVVRGQVSMQRESEKGWFDSSQHQADQDWEDTRLFFTPAYSISLDEMLDQAVKMTSNPPELTDGDPRSFLPVTLSPVDLPALIEYLILSVEASRKDKIKKIDISVALETPVLWVLP